MLIPSNVNIPNYFTNVFLLTNPTFLINLAWWVKFLSFKEKKLLTFLEIHLIVTWNFWLVSWWNFFKNCLVTNSFCGQDGNSSNTIFFWISQRLDGALTYLLVGVFYSTYTHSIWWHYSWKAMGRLCYQVLDESASVHCGIIRWTLHKSPWMVLCFGILENQSGVGFVYFRRTLLVIKLLLKYILELRNFSRLISHVKVMLGW